MGAKLKLEIISDVVCPWCIVGYRRLQTAMSELGVEERIAIEWHPFELNPEMPAEGEKLREHIVRKYGSTLNESRRLEEKITQLGAELGFRFDFFEAMRIVNTRAAHLLLDYAKEYGKQTELNIRLFNAYFGERKDISNRKTLAEELQQVGLDSDEALLRLEEVEAHKRIATAESYWQGLGVSSVPTMVFNHASALTGAQPVAVYKQVVTELLVDANTESREP